MSGEEEFRMPHGGRAGYPWVHKNGKGAWRLLIL